MADVAINADTADIPAVNFAQQGSDPTAPAASRWLLFFKAGGLYARKSDGTVIGPFGVSGDVATDAIWDAAGDLAVGTGANTAAKLAKGAALNVLRVNSGGTALEWAAPPSGAYTQGCRLRRSTDQTCNFGVETQVSFDTETYDDDTMHEGVTNPTRLTFTTAGVYIIGAQWAWEAATSGTRTLVTIRANGTTRLAADDCNNSQAGGEYSTRSLTTVYKATAGEYVELSIYVAGSFNRAVKAIDPSSPVLWASRVG